MAKILGISAFYHDSAACILDDGKIVAAAQEERFTRIKQDPSFPINAINYCLKEANLKTSDIDHIAFYDQPSLKFKRLLATYANFAPKGANSFVQAMSSWLSDKLWIKGCIKKNLNYKGPVHFPEHHESHAASAFYPSPYEQAAFLTIDGVGEWATTTYGVGSENNLDIQAEIKFPHSIGLLYSAFTYYLGFKVNSGEYKVMGLAPYGEPKFVDKILNNLIDLKDDGSFKMNMSYFNYCTGLTMTNRKFDELLGAPRRKPESLLTQREMDLARSIQEVTEIVMLKISEHIKKETSEKYLCLAGGVALNCVANGKLLRKKWFDDIWIQPAAGDAGGALGAALHTHYKVLKNKRVIKPNDDLMSGAYLGPKFDDQEILSFLNENKINYKKLSDEEVPVKVSNLIANGNIIGWFQGRMEFGPRALGSRSIIGDPRNPEMQKTMNLKVKYRESFRPFAPSVLADSSSNYFDIDRQSPYMLLVADVKKEKQKPMTEKQQKLFGLDKLNIKRSDIPAVTHVDYSARVQTVNKDYNPKYYKLISEFEKNHGCSVVINTSFNVRGEPIVCTPLNAYNCFMDTSIDYLVLGNYLLDKKNQPKLNKKRAQYELD